VRVNQLIVFDEAFLTSHFDAIQNEVRARRFLMSFSSCPKLESIVKRINGVLLECVLLAGGGFREHFVIFACMMCMRRLFLHFTSLPSMRSRRVLLYLRCRLNHDYLLFGNLNF
jgi:hypothetical protein